MGEGTGWNEDALERASYLDLAREASGIGLWRWDLEREEASGDPTSYGLYGLPGDQPLSVGAVAERVHPDDRARARAHVEEALRLGRFDPLELRVRVGSEVRWLLNIGNLHADAEGKPIAIFGGVLDVTQQHARREAEARHEKLEAMGRLAAGVAHNFNNLLVAILGSLELLKKSDEEAAPELIGEAEDAARAAAELTRGLLAFCRRGELQRESFDLRDVVDDAVLLLRRLLPRNVTLQLAGRGDTLRVHGDRSELEQVMLNLCLNARDAMGEQGGRIRIDLARAEGEEIGTEGAFARLRVRDEGEGIPDAELERLFEPFYSTRDTAAGLGLASVHGIVERHGGAVHVESLVGRGTTFRVYLPLDGSRPSAPPAPRVDPRGGDETLLLVEDEEPVRRTLKRILVRAGYEVLEAADAESAMALFAEASARIDAAILDAVLPDRSGLEVGAAIREARPDAPLILSTGYVDALDPKGHRGRLFDRVLAKPYPADELLGTLRELLDAAKASR